MQSAVAVTGGASGLGAVIAARLVASGRSVVVVDRDATALRASSAALGGAASVVVADLSSVEGVEAAARALLEHEDLTGLVNNAGGWASGPQYPEADPAVWQAALVLNLVAPMLLTQRLLPALAERTGAVVNIGSSGGVGDEPYGSPEYGAAKAGLRRFTASMGGRSDVRVMAVVPGWIGLDRAKAEWAALDREARRKAGALIPPEHIADLVVELFEHGRAGAVVELLHAPPLSGRSVQWEQ